LTVKFYHRGAGVEKIENAEDLGRIIDAWMAYRPTYDHLRENFLKLRYEEDPTMVIAELVDLAQEASGTALKPGPFPPKPRKPR
jgi:processive 1,2-diacylglycerol beta-glucosyltransferase